MLITDEVILIEIQLCKKKILTVFDGNMFVISIETCISNC